MDFARDHDPADWLPRVAEVDIVVNAVGILREGPGQNFEALHVKAPCALFAACARANVRKVVQISALGADDAARTRYHRSKKAADDFLAALPLDWVIAQPSLVFGEGGSSARLFATLAALPVLPLPGNGDQRVQPLHIDDLCVALVGLIETDLYDHRRVALVGPRPLQLREMLAELRAGLGSKPALVLPVPLTLVRIAARLGAALPRLLLDSETLDMLLRGNTAPATATRRLLGRAPRSVREFIPALQARWWADRARLAWLLPLLRAAVALTWIGTGIVSLGVYPVSESYALLARVGIGASLAPLFLYGAAVVDLALGIGIYVLRRARRWLWRAQMLLIAAYSVIIAAWLPEFWLHPFGPLLKNLPLLAAILLLHELEE